MLMSGSGKEHALFDTLEQKDVGLQEASESQFSVEGLMGCGLGLGEGEGEGDGGFGDGDGPGRGDGEGVVPQD